MCHFFVLSCSVTIPRTVLLQHLHSLDCHTAVYSLHHLTNLLALNEDDVIELLQNVPARDQHMQGKCVESRKHRKTPCTKYVLLSISARKNLFFRPASVNREDTAYQLFCGNYFKILLGGVNCLPRRSWEISLVSQGQISERVFLKW